MSTHTVYSDDCNLRVIYELYGVSHMVKDHSYSKR